MRRTLTILTFSLAAAVALAGCGSSDDTSTSSASSTTTTTAKGGTNTTTAAQAKANGPKCRALATYQYAELIAIKSAGKDKAEQDKTIAGLDKAAAALKKADKNLADETDLRVAYIKKTVAGTAVPEDEKTAAEKAKNQMNLFRSQNCPKSSGKKAGGAAGSTTTTAKPEATTTTKKK